MPSHIEHPCPHRSGSSLGVVLLLGALLGAGAWSSAQAQNLSLPPFPALPGTEPSAPSLWFDTADLPALAARKTDPAYSGLYTQFKGFVDARLTTLGSNPTAFTDEALAELAKNAALLHHLGDTPNAGGYGDYRDAAIDALAAIGPRDPVTLWQPSPPNPIEVLTDSTRLLNMVEAYDLLRGYVDTKPQNGTIRSRIADWAEALRSDIHLTGALGIPGHRDNWAIKASAPLISAAIAMPTAPGAANWYADGQTYLEQSLDAVASDTGWFRESPWYLNYSLNNLLPTLHHLRNRTGYDAFPAVRPWVEAALAMRQPDGRLAPFEEGLPVVFPYDVVASAYPDLAPQLNWAWQQSDQNTGNYENNQWNSVSATRFLLRDEASPAAAPNTPSTRFLGGDAGVHVLASSWDPDAVQVTMITARDHKDTTTTDLRHHVQNPMDLVLYGEGELVMPTSGGGPQVTNSTNRAIYLDPRSKNIPLVGGQAPFLTDVPGGWQYADNVHHKDRLDSHDRADLGLENHFADFGTTEVDGRYVGASGTVDVARTLALIDDRYVVVADRFEANGTEDFALAWHGRGTRTTPGASVRWSNAGLELDATFVSNRALTFNGTSSLYADAWNTEETIEGVEVHTSASNARMLSIFETRRGGAPRTVTDVSSATVAAARVEDGAFRDLIAFGPQGTLYTADNRMQTDAYLAIVREAVATGAVSSFALVRGAELRWDGEALLQASGPVTLGLSAQSDALLAEISIDQTGPFDLSLSYLPGLDPSLSYEAWWNGALLDASRFTQTLSGFSFTALSGGGTLWLRALTPLAVPEPGAAGLLVLAVLIAVLVRTRGR